MGRRLEKMVYFVVCGFCAYYWLNLSDSINKTKKRVLRKPNKSVCVTFLFVRFVPLRSTQRHATSEIIFFLIARLEENALSNSFLSDK